ncbi:hypothetical protein NP493_249g04017 [Ridgeia piscesae]|uniref:Nostrin n=1 Tax=Ridgeia piscesae TaxID=27915 RepID=A0AAD9NYQ4_RIDPI|nr:hypothetical protein NP493_249g04017 [Ridgeia piscesae]
MTLRRLQANLGIGLYGNPACKGTIRKGLNGFDELRKYIKQGNEFCREVSAIMQERSEAELIYAKALAKISAKLSKVSGNCLGTLSSSWALVATEMEAESEAHKQLSQALRDDLHKPMKNLADTQQKIRKPIESMVEKSLKTLTDRRNEESKLKKAAFMCAKEAEKIEEQLSNGRTATGRTKVTEKDLSKLDKRARNLSLTMQKTDTDYHDACLKAEAERQEWESTVYKGCSSLQTLEEDRISQMQELMNKYNSYLSVIGPQLVRSCDKVGEAVINIDVNSDLRNIVDKKGTGPNQPEQILLDYYAEDMTHGMEKERRRQVLQNYALHLQQDVEKEYKSREGVEKLVEVYQNRPSFADAEAQEDARQRLGHVSGVLCVQVNAMVNFVEAIQYKISCAVAELDGRPKPVDNRYAPYLERSKDKLGMTTSILRLPLSMAYQSYAATDGSATCRAPADGGQIDSPFDDDEFDTELSPPSSPLGQCRAIYDYTAQQYDELTIKCGDVITIYDKQEDGWWQGELHGKVGIFPASYVAET